LMSCPPRVGAPGGAVTESIILYGKQYVKRYYLAC
jgi:hypothetical protein